MANFSRRHYETIAKVIKSEVDLLKSIRPTVAKIYYESGMTTLRSLETQLSESFEADNPNFKRKAFREACGLTD